MNNKSRVSFTLIAVFMVVMGVLIFKQVNMGTQGIVQFSDSSKLRGSRQLELEGKRLLRQGLYVEAEKILKEADDPRFWLYENAPNGVARFWLRAAYFAQSKYQDALAVIDSNLSVVPDLKGTLNEKKIYEAMIDYQNTGRPDSVYHEIDSFKLSNADQLPPIRYDPIASIGLVSTILRLYNTIGDHDAGIRFIDEILTWTYAQEPSHFSKIKQVKTANEAMALGRWDVPSGKGRDPNWREYKFVWQYLTVREAFEQDKRDGFKGCAGSPPGQVCIGKATQALIQSDYFPW